ncbi:MAG: hypothetical protein K6T29_05935, partial [Peptococcaceae bacterium]|nr:hypothetical protein [Peptococcaceae bacterium]
EFWKQQQDIQADPMKAAEQMKEMGLLLNYGNDVTVDGNEYYVVNASLDMNRFRQGYQKMLQQLVQGLPQKGVQGSPQEMQQQLEKFLDSAQIDYYYTVLINKKTLLSDIVRLDARMNFAMKNPEPGGADATAQKDGMPGEVKMNLQMKGQFAIHDAGKPFAAPDVSKATEMLKH